eukprot:3885539-Karenia_brevis.AAC.1
MHQIDIRVCYEDHEYPKYEKQYDHLYIHLPKHQIWEWDCGTPALCQLSYSQPSSKLQGGSAVQCQRHLNCPYQ